jgi:hypothetical protein
MGVPQEAQSVKHAAFTADQAGLLKRFCRDLQARGIGNVESIARDFVLDDYGEEGLTIFSHAADPRLASLDSPLPAEGEDSGGVDRTEGRLESPGAFAMSLAVDDLAGDIKIARRVGMIDSQQADSYRKSLASDTGRQWVQGELQKNAMLAKAKATAMSLAAAKEQSADDYGRELMLGKAAEPSALGKWAATPGNIAGPRPEAPPAEPFAPKTAYGEPMQIGFADDPVAVEYGRKLAGVK